MQIVAASKRGGVTSSIPTRRGLAWALATAAFPEGPPYLKVEGLAALPDGRLLFGIRGAGASKEKFDFAVKIVSVVAFLSWCRQQKWIEELPDIERSKDARNPRQRSRRRVAELAPDLSPT